MGRRAAPPPVEVCDDVEQTMEQRAASWTREAIEDRSMESFVAWTLPAHLRTCAYIVLFWADTACRQVKNFRVEGWMGLSQ
jgi:hypothetical protein